ncbi:MAG: RHS repeat-associated core domain-containing protein [Desulfovibrio sp.]|nr:RHS repeat-associated core domain-containing protein [Desulfovibrio sp.]
MLTQTRPDGEVTSFSYDNNGNLSSLSPPGRPAHLFEHTPVDLESKYTPPEAGFTPRETETFYTLDREVEAVVLPDARVIDLDYDPAGRLSSVVTSAGIYGYSYDFADRVETLTAPGGETLVFGYDGSQLTQSTWAGTVSGSITNVYDADLRLSTQLVNGDYPVAYNYDQDSLLESYSISGAGGTPTATLVTTRNVLNGRLETTTAGVVTDERHYNGHGELDHYTARVSSVVVFEVDYVRDGLGRIDVKTETVNGTTKAFDYDYDLAGRLTDVWEDAVLVEHYEYDPNGNRTLGVVRGVASVGTYDDQDRLLSYGDFAYTYTANGELLTKTDTSNGEVTLYSYDELGNLREATLPNGDHLEYVIDGLNRRIGKKVNGTLVQGFLYGDQLDPIAEVDGTGNVVSRFGYGTVGHSADTIVKGGRAYRVIMDHVGSPRLVVDQLTGAVAQELDYDAWGNTLVDSAPDWQPFGFVGGIDDREAMLVRYGLRDLDLSTGRWVAPDPVGLGAGSNRFLYGFGDPTNRIDPSGAAVRVRAGKGVDLSKLKMSPEGVLTLALQHIQENSKLKDWFNELLNKKNKSLEDLICGDLDVDITIWSKSGNQTKYDSVFLGASAEQANRSIGMEAAQFDPLLWTSASDVFDAASNMIHELAHFVEAYSLGGTWPDVPGDTGQWVEDQLVSLE